MMGQWEQSESHLLLFATFRGTLAGARSLPSGKGEVQSGHLSSVVQGWTKKGLSVISDILSLEYAALNVHDIILSLHSLVFPSLGMM